MDQYARESFIVVPFLLKNFSKNCRDDLIFDCMLEIIAGDELESVMLPDILDTLACHLCCSCWEVWIVYFVDSFLVERQVYLCVEHGWHVVPDQSVALSSN